MNSPFDPGVWEALPFHFWSVVFFVFGSLVGSFLNVCIYRMPRGESIVSPASHCPACGYSIPWYLNIPLVTWMMLRGRCRNCRAPIAARYFLVELLTAIAFLSCWWAFGGLSAGMALASALLLAGFIVATFIDLEHLIIPDEITMGGMVAGVLCSALVPMLHGAGSAVRGLESSFVGLVVGGALVYAILRAGKLLYGRQNVALGENSRVVFTETGLVLPTEEIPYGELLYRASDTIRLQAKRVELVDRCYADVEVRLSQTSLLVGEDRFDPETVAWMQVETGALILPREAMGLGDVKFMAAIGAFVGWKGVLFSLMFSAFIGALVGVTLIASGKREWSSRLPYGPYIAVAATIWVFYGQDILRWWWPVH